MTSRADILPALDLSRTIHQDRAFQTFDVLGVPIAAIDMDQAIRLIATWVDRRQGPRIVTFSNVHMVTEAHDRPELLSILRETDLNCPDGMPLAWLGKRRFKTMSKVSGPDFLQEFCVANRGTRIRHFFYGGANGILTRMVSELRSRHPEIEVAGYYSPPFRALSKTEDEEVIARINESRPDVVWVSLGCPKQEFWMREHRDRLHASVLLGVGQAFDIAAGAKRRAPRLMRAHGYEWLFRAVQEPGRLSRRYTISNSKFLWLLALERSKALIDGSSHRFTHKYSIDKANEDL